MEDWSRVEQAPTIENFYREHARAVYAFCVSLSRDPVWAEDLMQDTFARATRSLGGYKGGDPKSWLFTIARSVYIDDIRKRKPMPSEDVDTAPSTDPDVAEIEVISEALATLPERQRTALLLADQAGVSHSEIADALGATPGAVKVLVHRARINFRKAYEAMNR
jgi:RNA polymerase sigma factor (sigma-70 family)